MRKIALALFAAAITLLQGCSALRATPEELTAESDLNKEVTARVETKADAYSDTVKACPDPGPISGLPAYSCDAGDYGCSRAYGDLLRAYEEASEAGGDCVSSVAQQGQLASSVGVIERSNANAELLGKAMDLGAAFIPGLTSVGLAREVRKTAQSNNQVISNVVDSSGRPTGPVTNITGSYNSEEANGNLAVNQGAGSVYGSGQVGSNTDTSTVVNDQGRFDSPGATAGSDNCDGPSCQPVNSLNPVTTPTPVVVNGRVCALVPSVDPMAPPGTVILQCDP